MLAAIAVLIALASLSSVTASSAILAVVIPPVAMSATTAPAAILSAVIALSLMCTVSTTSSEGVPMSTF